MRKSLTKQRTDQEATQQYLGVAEAATMTGTSPWFWRRKAYAGTVSSVKLGTRLLIPRAEIERFIEENTCPRVLSAESQPAAAEPKESR
jgi:excisionase family DNA binding protein